MIVDASLELPFADRRILRMGSDWFRCDQSGVRARLFHGCDEAHATILEMLSDVSELKGSTESLRATTLSTGFASFVSAETRTCDVVYGCLQAGSHSEITDCPINVLRAEICGSVLTMTAIYRIWVSPTVSLVPLGSLVVALVAS